MRTVRVNLPLAVMLGLAGSSTAFLQSVRPTNFVVPAHKYNAAVSRTRAVQPRAAVAPAARNMRIMSAAVDETTEATEVVSSDTDGEAAAATTAAAVEIPVATEDDAMLEVRRDIHVITESETVGGGGGEKEVGYVCYGEVG